MSKPYPQLSTQQQIDQRARPVFEKAVGDWAFPMQLIPDQVGIDYVVERFPRDSTGENPVGAGDFFVQLKGTTKPSIVRECISFEFEVRRLKYYFQHKKRPVFLVLVDVNAEKGYWLFLQRYIADHLEGTDWRAQETINVHVPMSQRLEDRNTFETAVGNADSWMPRLWPGTMDDVLRGQKAELEAIDPRIEVDLSKSNASVELAVRQKDPIAGTISFAGSTDAVAKATAAFERGKQVDAKGYGVEIQVDGLPGEPPGPRQVASLHHGNVQPATVVLTGYSGKGTRLGDMEVQGKVRLGPKGFYLWGSLPSGLIAFEITGEPEGPGVRTALQYNFDLTPWLQKPVFLLPDYDRTKRVFGPMEDLETLGIELFLDGNSLGAIQVPLKEEPQLGCLAWMVHLVDRLRFIGAARKLSLTIPLPPTQVELSQAERCYRILKGEPVQIGVSNVSLTTVTPAAQLALLRAQHPQIIESLQLPKEQYLHPLLGSEVDLGPVLIRFERAEITFGSVLDDSDPAAVRARWDITPIGTSSVQGGWHDKPKGAITRRPTPPSPPTSSSAAQ